jgi:hypothetical protein
MKVKDLIEALMAVEDIEAPLTIQATTGMDDNCRNTYEWYYNFTVSDKDQYSKSVTLHIGRWP